MTEVGIVMGSDSGMPMMIQAVAFLEKMGTEYETCITSVHRKPDVFFEWVNGARERGLSVIIAGIGKATHLLGMYTALLLLSVIGIPMRTSDPGGADSLYSIVQMSSGISRAIIAINGGKSMGILTVRTLAVGDKVLEERLQAFQKKMYDEVVGEGEKLRREGCQGFLKRGKPRWIIETPELILRWAMRPQS